MVHQRPTNYFLRSKILILQVVLIPAALFNDASSVDVSKIHSSIYSTIRSSQTIEAKNPYQNGCLQAIHRRRLQLENKDNRSLQDIEKKENENSGMADVGSKKDYVQYPRRVCNSDDELIGNTDCLEPTFDNYLEVRIGAGNWDECKL